MLKHHADAGSDLRQIAIAHDNAGAIDADPLSVQIDLPGVRTFEPVDTTQQCGFARARWPEHADRLTLVDLETDVGKDFDIAKPLRHPGDIENLAELCHRPSLSTCFGNAADRTHPSLDHETESPIQKHRRNEGRERNVMPRLDRAGGVR